MKLLVTGASGSGTTTLGRALMRELGIEAIDTDDFYWLPTDPPYQQKRDLDERLALILARQRAAGRSVISGSIINWGEALEDSFDFIIFLYLAADIRLARLRAREMAELGRVDEAFMEWAAGYDTDPGGGRSLERHRGWLAARQCPVLELVGDLTVAERVARVRDALKGIQ